MLSIELPLEKTILVSKLTNYVTPKNDLQIAFSVSTKVDRLLAVGFPVQG
jgi:hypothetical protein